MMVNKTVHIDVTQLCWHQKAILTLADLHKTDHLRTVSPDIRGGDIVKNFKDRRNGKRIFKTLASWEKYV